MDVYSDEILREALRSARVIAAVGASRNPARPSHYVSRYLLEHGYQVVAINPGLAGQQMFGGPVFAALADMPDTIPVDFVNIFRRSEDVPPIVDHALASLPALRTIWMQVGIANAAACQVGHDAGKTVIMDRCTRTEHRRLLAAN